MTFNRMRHGWLMCIWPNARCSHDCCWRPFPPRWRLLPLPLLLPLLVLAEAPDAARCVLAVVPCSSSLPLVLPPMEGAALSGSLLAAHEAVGRRKLLSLPL